MIKVLIIDRDGALIYEPTEGAIDSLDKLHLMPEAVSSLKQLVDVGFTLVMVSYQPGLGKSHFPETAFDVPHNQVIQTFKEAGVTFLHVYICPHTEAEHCNCRKPHPGLVTQFLAENDIDYVHSYVIGDSLADLGLADNIGVKGILFSNQSSRKAVFSSKSWKAITKYILGREDKL